MWWKRKNIKEKGKISFFWTEENFMAYDWSEYIDQYPYTLSVFEREESSFSTVVAEIFAEIAVRLTQNSRVLHCAEKQTPFYAVGVQKELFQRQIDLHHGWETTELFCFSGKKNEEIGDCELYFMVDLLRVNLTMKCQTKDLWHKAKSCMVDVMKERSICFLHWEPTE